MKDGLHFSTVIFDLDGTLIDHFESIHKCFNYAFEKVGAPLRSFEETKHAVGGSLEMSMRHFIEDERYEEALRHFREHMSGPTGVEGARLMDGATETLEALREKGVKMAMLTNKRGEVMRRLLKHLNVDGYFEVALGVNDTPWRKPQAELTRFILERLGATAEETLVVGDSPFDVATAHVMGMKVCVMPTGTHTVEELEKLEPEWLVGSLRDVLEVVLKR